VSDKFVLYNEELKGRYKTLVDAGFFLNSLSLWLVIIPYIS